jgi:hypothetical protein
MQKTNIVNKSLLLLALSFLFSVSLEAQTMKNGDKASGVSYYMVTLIGVYYQDRREVGQSL